MWNIKKMLLYLGWTEYHFLFRFYNILIVSIIFLWILSLSAVFFWLTQKLVSTIRRREKDWWRREAVKSEALSRREARARRRRVCTFLIVTKIIILWGELAALTPLRAASKGNGEIKSPSPFVSYCSHVSTRSLRGICNFASAKLTARKGHTGVAPLNNNKYV